MKAPIFLRSRSGDFEGDILMFLLTIAMFIFINRAGFAGQLQEPLSFKGIKIGMSRSELDLFLKNSCWENLLESKTGDVTLYRKNSEKCSDTARIGCDGLGNCYEVQSINCVFHDYKIVRLILESKLFSADKIDAYLKEWIDFAFFALQKKYGKPSLIVKNPESVTYSDFKSGFIVYLCEWRVGSQKILLGIGENEAEFNSSIVYQDIAGVRKLEKVKSKKTSEL